MKKTDEFGETQPMPAVKRDGSSQSLPAASQQPKSSSRPPGSRPPLSLRGDDLFSDEAQSRTTETAIEAPPPVKERNRAALRVLSGFNAGQVFALDRRETVVGRGRDTQIRLEDAGVSRRHTKIVQALDGRFFIEDLGSTNGTYVGSTRIDRTEVTSGDHIQIGPNVVLSFALIDEAEERLAKQLYESSTRDALTKAYNRKYFAERLSAEVAYANRHHSRLAVVLFDLDHFKTINDTHGHFAGDEVLRAVATKVTQMIRAEDLFARYGGEEFVLLVRGIDHPNVVRFAERIRRGVEGLQIPYAETTIKITTSAGVASLSEITKQVPLSTDPRVDADVAPSTQASPDPQNASTSRGWPVAATVPQGEDLLVLADERLYRAKGAGRNRVAS